MKKKAPRQPFLVGCPEPVCLVESSFIQERKKYALQFIVSMNGLVNFITEYRKYENTEKSGHKGVHFYLVRGG